MSSNESASEEEIKGKGKRIATKKQPARNAKKTKVESDNDSGDIEFTPASKSKSPKKKTAKSSKKKKAQKEKGSEEEDGSDSEKAIPKKKSSISGATPIDMTVPIKPITEDDSKYIKIVSWNVASFRSILKKGFQEYLDAEKPDILFLQEIKLNSDADIKGVSFEGYETFFNYCKRKKGYSGTACFTKIKPIKVTYDIGFENHDQEGRSITLELNDYYVIGTYVPNAGQKLERLKYRTEEWDRDFLTYIKGLDAKKPVIWTGDLNVAHQEIDINKPNPKLAGYTPEERANFTKLLESGFVDAWRKLNPGVVQYTYWNLRTPRENNVGWRLDYFVVSERLFPKVVNSFVRQTVKGSDHCPLGLLLPRD